MYIVPAYTGELVDFITGFSAKEFGNRLALFVHDVHCQRGCASRNLQRVVLVRKASQEPRRMNAALSAKSDKATRPLAVRGGRHYIQRIVERRDQPRKR